MKEQLASETTARLQAQANSHNLLVQNRELLLHISALVRQLQELESSLTGAQADNFNILKTPVHVSLRPVKPSILPVDLLDFTE